MSVSVAHTPTAWASVTTSNEQAADAAKGEECSNPEDGDIEIRQKWLMSEPESKRRRHHDYDFVMVIKNPLFARYDLRRPDHCKECGDRGGGDAGQDSAS